MFPQQQVSFPVEPTTLPARQVERCTEIIIREWNAASEALIRQGRELLTKRLAPEMAAPLVDFEACLTRNENKENPFYCVPMLVNSEDQVVSMATGTVTPNGSLLVGYTVTAEECGGRGYGSRTFEMLVEECRAAAIERSFKPIQMMILEAANESPRFWGKQGFLDVFVETADGGRKRFEYPQPPMDFDYATGLPITEDGHNLMVEVMLAGGSYSFPGVQERLLVLPLPGNPVGPEQILEGVRSLYGEYCFYPERELSPEGRVTYNQLKEAVVEALGERLRAGRVSLASIAEQRAESSLQGDFGDLL